MTRNVVVVCLDSVRQDVFTNVATRLQNRADLLFDQCRAASSWSVPSHASMLTGELPSKHGIHTHNRDFSNLNREDTFLDDLPDHNAIGVSANLYASTMFGFDGVFNEFCDVSRHHRYPEGLSPREYYQSSDRGGLSLYASFLRAALAHNHPLKSLANGALAQIKTFAKGRPIPNPLDEGARPVVRQATESIEASDEPVFAFLNIMDAHPPLEPTVHMDGSLHSVPNKFSTHGRDVWDLIRNPEDHENYFEYREQLYNAAVDYLDQVVVSFIETVQAKTDRETTFIITADHGDNMGLESEDGLVNHKSSLSEGLLHVPLIVCNAPHEIPTNGYVSHLNLGDLVVALATESDVDVTRQQIPAELVGMSGGDDLPEELDYEYWDRMIRCVYEGMTKYEWDSEGGARKCRLDSNRPCWQSCENSRDVPEWAKELFGSDIKSAKQRELKSDTETKDISAATQEQLKELGYL